MEGKGDVKTQSVYRGSGYRATLSAMVRGVKREAKHTHMIGVQCALCSSLLCFGLPRPYLSLIEGTLFCCQDFVTCGANTWFAVLLLNVKYQLFL